MASPNAASWAAHAAFLAMRGVTGPLGIFEANKGRGDTIAGAFSVDWAGEDLERVRRTILRRYNAEIHSQSAIEALLELRRQYGFRAQDVHRIEAEVFDVAFDMIGGDEEGERRRVRTKEQADHSLPYLLAVAAIDGGVWPEQFAPERIAAADVQSLLQRVEIRPAEDLSRLFPAHQACRIRVLLADGRTVALQKQDYEGFFTHPMGWESVRAKFERLAGHPGEDSRLANLASTVAHLDELEASELAAKLAAAGRPGGDP